MKRTQKFKKYDLIKVNKQLSESKSHFECDCEAIIIGSYRDQYGGENTSQYTIYIKGSGEVSWYNEDELSLVESDRQDLLAQWKKEWEDEYLLKGDIDWIFNNGKDVLDNPHGSSVASLARCFGLTNLWGNSGEGVVYYENSRITLMAAYPFLLKGDKIGWLDKCNKFILSKGESNVVR